MGEIVSFSVGNLVVKHNWEVKDTTKRKKVEGSRKSKEHIARYNLSEIWMF